MRKGDLKAQTGKGPEISTDASALHGECENLQGSVKQMLCKVCGTPVFGPALPICGNHAYVGQ